MITPPTCDVCGRTYVPALVVRTLTDGTRVMRGTHPSNNRAARKCDGHRLAEWIEEPHRPARLEEKP